VVDVGLAVRSSFLRDAPYSFGRRNASNVWHRWPLDSFIRFAIKGLGTPAPVFPTRHLVVTGLYRYVRNPMYVAVVITILGQGLIFGNAALLEYGGLIWLLFHLFVLIYEEPTLRASFGFEYEHFCTGVPRWIPRFRPWSG
jgi:protein-S-isoprenylcysteine O-methyltransferase Ste14